MGEGGGGELGGGGGCGGRLLGRLGRGLSEIKGSENRDSFFAYLC